MRKSLYDYVVFIYQILVLFVIQIGGIVLTYFNVDSMYYSNILFYVSIIGLFIYLYYKMQINKFEVKDFFVLLFVFFSIISFCFAKDKYIALNGFIGRREGLLALFSYYISFIVASTLKNKKFLKKFVVILSFHCFFQIIYGYLQVIGLNSILGVSIKYNIFHYSFGTVGNSNFFSSLMLMGLAIWIGIYFFNERVFNWKVLFPLEIFTIGLVLSGAMSGFVGFLFVMLLLFIYIIYLLLKKERVFEYILKIGVVFVLFFWSISFLTYYANNQYFLDVFDLNIETKQIVNEGFKEENGTGRIHIWKVALKNAPRYLLTGIGIDQFMYVDDGSLIIDPITGNIVDKAHNEYLQILLTEGIFKCITYIIFLLWIFFKAVCLIIKLKKIDGVFLGLFLSFTGYAVQAFFNISVTLVAPIFFIISGFLLSEIESINKNIKE